MQSRTGNFDSKIAGLLRQFRSQEDNLDWHNISSSLMKYAALRKDGTYATYGTNETVVFAPS
jgi:hypothetical protein